MDNFDWTKFSKRLFINADLKTVYASWTKSAELEKWFLSKAIFISKEGKKISPLAELTAECQYRWNWFAQNHYEEGSILQTNGIDSLAFTFAGNCTVQIKLSTVKDQTLVELTQSDIPLDNSSKKSIRLGCAAGWAFYLLNLKSVLEGGLDLRNKDTTLVGVVNN